MFRFYRLSDRLILNNALDTEMGSSDIDSAMRSFLCLCRKGFASFGVFLPFDVSLKEKCTFMSRYFRAITEYMQQLRHSLGELRDDIEYDLPNSLNLNVNSQNLCTRAVAQEELNAADAEKITGIAILSFIRFTSSNIHSLHETQSDYSSLTFDISNIST